MHLLTRWTNWYGRNQVLAWICILIAVNQLGFGSVVPVLPLYAASFGVSKGLIGLTIAVYGLARFLTSVPAGRIADAAGRRWALAVGGVISVLGNLFSGLAGNYELFLTGRFVSGIGAAMVLTGCQIILTDITTPANRGRTMAIYMSVFLFAVGIGPLPGGFLAQHISLGFPFYAYAALATVVTLLAFFKVPETRDYRSDGSASPRIQVSFSQQMRVLSRQPAFMLVSFVAFTAFFARTGGLFNLVPQRAENVMGLSPSQIGFGLASISIVSLVLAYPSGVIVDRYGRKAVIVPSTLLSGVGLAMFGVGAGFGWFLLSCLIWAVAGGIASAAPTAYAADIAPAGMNAAAMGTFRMLSDSGYVLGPALLGWGADFFGTTVVLFLTSAMLIVSGLAFARFAHETYRSQPAVPKRRERPAD